MARAARTDEGGGTGRREGKGRPGRVIGLRDRAAMVGHGVSTHSCSGVGYVQMTDRVCANCLEKVCLPEVVVLRRLCLVKCDL